MRSAAVGDVYNIGGGQAITLRNAVRLLAGSLGVEPAITYGPPRAGDQRHTAADVSKARDALAYTPRVNPDLGLRSQVLWHTKRGDSQLGSTFKERVA
jgi:nucleoside-diphosphate-sugar epimerase